MRMILSTSAMGQITTAPGCVVILASSGQNRPGRIRQDEQKMLDLTVGQVVQSIRLQAAGMDLVSVPAKNLDMNVIRRTCSFPKLITPYHMLFVGYVPGQAPTATTSNASPFAPAQGTPKRAVMVLPSQGFRDEELIDTVRVLNASSILTVIAGPEVGVVRGMLGTAIQVEMPLQQLDVDKFDAIVFVGGTGSLEYVNNPLATSVAGEAIRKGKIVAASSMAPMILASAGLLKGVSVTGFNGNRQALISAGATYTGKAVERDRLIITSSGPTATVLFAKAIAEALYSQ
jgi:protease I